MQSQVMSVLRLDETSLHGKLVHVCEEDDMMGMFLLHNFIHLAAEKSEKILLIGMENSFGHFNSVGMKFGINLLNLKTTQKLTFFDGLAKISELLDSNNDFAKVLIEELQQFLVNNVTSRSLIVLDNLSFLKGLGLQMGHLNKLLNIIQSLAVKNQATVVIRSRFFIVPDSDKRADEEINQLPNLISHKSSLNISVRPLSTGKSQRVTGHFSFLWNFQTSTNQYLYRLEEKDVKIFAA